MGIGICRTCGVEFERNGRGPYKYCEAHRVSDKERRARAQRELRTRHREAKSPVKCRECGVDFMAMRSDARWCPNCRVEKNKLKAERYEQRQRGIRQWDCVVCGKEVSRRSQRCRTCSDKTRSGEGSANWRGGRTKKNGYIYIRVEGKGPYQSEHLLVWEKANGKPLPKGWVIHHLNGVKDDNRPENLLGLPSNQHHTHPRETLRPYERRIKKLEEEIGVLRELRLNI